MSEKTAKEKRREAQPTNGELYAGMEAIAKLLRIDFHVSDSLKLRKLKQQLVDTHRVIAEVRDKLVQKHGTENPKGSGRFEVTGPNSPKNTPMSEGYLDFLEEIAILMLEKAEAKYDKIKLPSIIDGRPISVSSDDLEKLDLFVEFK